MLARDDNDRVTRVGPGTPMGETLRRYWLPALLAWELPEPDCPPVRVKLLQEELVAFRDSCGRVGLLDERCPHRQASLFLGRNEECGLRCVYHGWKFDVDGQCVDMFRSKRNRDNGYLLDRRVQKTETFTGIDGINVQDRAVQESMSPIVDRSREHLGPADRAVIQARRLLLQATRTVEAGGVPPGVEPTYYTLHPAEAVVARETDWRSLVAPDAPRAPVLERV